jgi:hypothetical protein
MAYHTSRSIKKASAAAEVVGSNPTRSIFINLVNYGIVLSSLLTIVGQIPQQCTLKTHRLVTGEIEMLKVVLYLVRRERAGREEAS